MAWNEPGGGKNRDPWSGGGGGGNQGPPDLDEVLRKLKERFNRFFGGRGNGVGGGGGSGSGSGGVGTVGILVLVGIAVVGWLLSGIYIVDQGLQASVTRFGKHVQTAGPGPHWHWPYPIGGVEKVNVRVRRSLSIGGDSAGVGGGRSGLSDSIMLTADENLVSVSMDVQYRVSDAYAYLYRFNDPDKTLRDVAISALRQVVGKRELGDLLAQDDLDVTFDQLGQQVQLSDEQIQSLREQSTLVEQQDEGAEGGEDTEPVDLVTAIRDVIIEHVEGYGLGLEIIEVNVGRTRPPQPVQAAFDDAVRAREDMRRLIQEAIAYKNQQVPQARGRAARLTAEAKSYAAQTTNAAQGAAQRFSQLAREYAQAPAITRERLYLETMQTVLSQSGKVLVDTKGGQPLMYMPLDRLLKRGTGGRGGSGDTVGQGSGTTPPYRTGGGSSASSGSSSDSSGRSRARETR